MAIYTQAYGKGRKVDMPGLKFMPKDVDWWLKRHPWNA
jgi:hypothetical protein